ncbi:MAG: hypothetical protein AB7I50_17270 [Vicinamibacterales bacterium]
MTRQTAHEVIAVDGREVIVSNPDKVLFPQAGHTKRDLVHYYLAVASGALRAAGGRPNVLVRYPHGVDGEYFYQKRAPAPRPTWMDVVDLAFPSGRTAQEVVPREISPSTTQPGGNASRSVAWSSGKYRSRGRKSRLCM